MSNGMRSCAQGARGAVSALQPVMAFCHKNLGLLNKRVSTQSPAPKLKAWGSRQDLALTVPWWACLILFTPAIYISPVCADSSPVFTNCQSAHSTGLGDLGTRMAAEEQAYVAPCTNIGGCMWGDGHIAPYGNYVISYGPVVNPGSYMTSVSCSSDPVKDSGPPHCPNQTGNPINSGTGNKYQNEIDLSEPAFKLARAYNSTPGSVSTNSKYGWQHSYEKQLSLLKIQKQKIWALRSTGVARLFKNTGSAWLPDADIPDRLAELKDTNGVRTGWRYTVAADDSIETYSATGKLSAIADRTGRTQTLAYDIPINSGGDDDPETLDTVTDDTGRQLRFTYDAYKRIATVTDPAGGIITYGYDAQSNLVSVTYPDGRSKTYHYNEPEHTAGADLPHALTGITDENGDRYATYQYDADGKAISTGHANGADLHTLTYNPDGSTTVTDPLGTARTHTFTTILGVVKSTGQSQPGGSGCGAASSATTYDANGNVASPCRLQRPQDLLRLRPDAQPRNRPRRRPGIRYRLPGRTSPPTPPPPTAPSARYSPSGMRPSVCRSRSPKPAAKPAPSTTTTATSPAPQHQGHRPQQDAHLDHQLHLPRQRPRRAGAESRRRPAHRRHAISPPPTTTPRTRTASAATWAAAARSSRSPTPSATSRRTTNTTPTATSPRPPTPTASSPPSVTPRAAGCKAADVGGETHELRLRRRRSAHQAHPSRRQLRQLRIRPRPPSDRDRRAGRQPPHLHPRRRGQPHPGRHHRPGRRTVYYTHRRTFDALGRLWQDIGAYNQTVTYEYDAQGNLKQIDGARTDVADLTRHDYDTLDRLTQTLNADGGIEQTTPNALDQTTRSSTRLTRPPPTPSMPSATSPRPSSADTGTTIRTYDEAGNLKTETDARGVTVTYTYDALNRLTQKQSSRAPAPSTSTSTTTAAPAACVRRRRNGTPDDQFTYDAQGRLASRLAAGTSGAFNYAYRPGGQLSTLTYPTGRSVTYSYDPQGRISQVVTQPASGTPVTVLASNFVPATPSPARELQLRQRPIVLPEAATRITAPAPYRWPELQSPQSRPRRNVAGGYGRHHNTFTHLHLRRHRAASSAPLNSATGSFGSLAWSYDLNGNRQSETRNAGTMPYVYSPPAATGCTSAAATPAPRPQTATPHRSAASPASPTTATTASSPAPPQRNHHLHLQRPRRAHQENQPERPVHRLPLRTERRTSLGKGRQAGNTKAYVWLDGRPLARIDNDAQIVYYHVDHLGTPQAMTDAAGATVWKADYEPFGKATVKVNNVENNLRFPGQYYDRETGLHYNYFRDYDPSTGRYVEADPIGLEGGLNVYGYVDNNPVVYTDPLGLAKVGPRAPTLPYPQPATPYPWGKPGTPSAPQGLPIDRDRPTERPDRCERPDRDEECEQRRNEDESACTIPIIRYGYARGKACLDSAMIRYGECLRFGVDGIRTPLHGVDTPL